MKWKNWFFQREGSYTEELRLDRSELIGGHVPRRLLPDQIVDSVCGYCSTGCSLRVHLREDEAVTVTGTPTYPVNRGMACPKGWEAVRVLQASDRATAPLLRIGRRDWKRLSWNDAINLFVQRMKAIQQQYGRDAVAFLGTGQLTTEELAFLGSLAKFGMGILDGDGNTRQCMASAVVAYQQAFGFDAPPYTYADLEQSDVLLFIGANPCIAHPILWQRVAQRRDNPTVIVIDPRTTETASQATLHVRVRPKTDLLLLYGIAKLLIENGWTNPEFIRNHTTGYQEFASFVQQFDIQRVVNETGVPGHIIKELAKAIGCGRRVSFWWTMGVNQSHQGVRTAQAIINLALLTGNIGRPGTGANSITGQCNAMGSRLFANTTNLLGGHDFTNPQHRNKVARILQIDETMIPHRKSLDYHHILEEVIRGRIRALWIVCTNPAHSWINQQLCHEVLERLDFLVVQDMYYSTETTRVAHLVLPAAGWGEKEGTFINSERRIGRVRKVAEPPGEALPDFVIFQRIARAWGCGRWIERWSDPESVFRILQELTAGQPCDFTGIDGYAHLEREGGIQWPYPRNAPDRRPERRLFEDGRFFHPDGRARFCFEEPRPPFEQPDASYPLLLNTGRGTAVQWHTQTRTSKSPLLRNLYPRQLTIEIHPNDARRLGIRPYDRVEVTSRRGRLVAAAFVTPTVPEGQVFLPMHYPEVNRLTPSVFDPYSFQPAYKHCAVRVTKLGSSLASGQ
ncbi:MAG: nitrate reductase catalytic subunit [Pirellulaceae bacterium]|nr:MAG: nitrate reductase catalytic subunit [Pirellulaceae bacterium]